MENKWRLGAPPRGQGGRTFADFLRPKRAAPTLPVPLFDLPHRARVEAELGRPIRLRAVLDPAACARRGVEAFLEGHVCTFATAAPAWETVEALLRGWAG